jgi:hypothetical protein
MIHRATLEEFIKVKVTDVLRPTVTRLACPGASPPYGTCEQFSFSLPLRLYLDNCGFLIRGALSDERTGL